MQEPQPEYNDEFAATIIKELLPNSEITKIVAPSARMGKEESILFDYGQRGKLLSFQKALDLDAQATFDILIDDDQGIKLRHKIIIGTDLANWKILRKETSWPKDNPFKRTYLLVRNNNENQAIRGIAFYKGAMANISITGMLNDSIIKTLEEVTWKMAGRLESIYDKKIKEISEGPLFVDNPIITRPDLPDPDINQKRI